MKSLVSQSYGNIYTVRVITIIVDVQEDVLVVDRLPADRLLLPRAAVQQISQQLLHLCVVQATSGQAPPS